MPRVLMVTDGLWNGGAERQLALLIASLPEPWSASVLSMEDGPYRPVLESLGVEVRIAPRVHRFDVTPAVRMWRIASGIGPDIVHSWGWMSSIAIIPFCRTHRIPLLNGIIRGGRGPSRRVLMERLSLSLSDVVVANSHAGLAAYGIAESGRARVIHNGFDFGRLKPVAADVRDFGRSDGTVAIMAARMYPAKDWRSFLRVARVLATEGRGWRFVAVGAGPERDALLAEAADLVGSGVVVFPEAGVEAIPMIATADLGVLLTDPQRAAEGCSNSIMEYMACGLPVVCTDSGGNPELVEDGVTGFLVPSGGTEALVSALRTLRDDPARAREMGRAGRRRVQERFGVDAMVEAFVATYEFALHIRGRANP